MSQQVQATPPMNAPSSSTFTFAAPYPPTTTGASQATLKQRRVSLALPNSPRLVPAWNFRDDTTIDAHVASGSPLAPEKKGKMRKTLSDEQKAADRLAVAMPEKRQRKKWTEEETQMLVSGCNIVRLIALCSCIPQLMIYFSSGASATGKPSSMTQA